MLVHTFSPSNQESEADSERKERKNFRGQREDSGGTGTCCQS